MRVEQINLQNKPGIQQ